MQNKEIEIYNSIMNKVDRVPQKNGIGLSGCLKSVSGGIALSYTDIFMPLRKVIICTFILGFFTGFLIMGGDTTVIASYEGDWLSNPESEFQLFL
jgi:hypothetical protein